MDDATLEQLAKALEALEGSQDAIPAELLHALSGLAEPGMKLTIDLDATRKLGAPILTVEDRRAQDRFFGQLTPRQSEVARRVVAGQSNPQIAKDLSISLATVKDHVHAILTRLELPSRVALILAAHSMEQR